MYTCKVLTHNVSKKNDYLHAISPAFLLRSLLLFSLDNQAFDCTENWLYRLGDH